MKKDKPKQESPEKPSGCNIPIQLVGLYKKLKNSEHPYASAIAAHNEQEYRFCPYASNSCNISEKILTKAQ